MERTEKRVQAENIVIIGPMRSRKEKIHYGDLAEVNGKRRILLSQRNKAELLTIEEIASDYFKREVASVEVTFKDDVTM